MNREQKEILQSQLNNEEQIIKELKHIFGQAQDDVVNRIIDLSRRRDMENLQTIIYQKQYQEVLKKQIDNILDTLHTNEFSTIEEYLTACYSDGYIGTMYDIAGQGIPLIIPIDTKQVLEAIQTESNLSKKLYDRLGEDVGELKKAVRAELSRGIANGSSWNEIGAQLSKNMKHTPFQKAINNSIRIARTEGHRIQCKATMDAQQKAKSKGANIVKQWDSTLDSRTRPSHKRVDGQIRELDEEFSNGLKYPSDPKGKASEVINCRCALLQRAKWALDEEELNTLKKRAEFYELDKTEDFEDYKKKYLKAQEQEKVQQSAQKMNDKGTSQEKAIEKDNKYFDAISELKEKGVIIDISGAGKYEAEAKESLVHLKDLMNEYNSTVVSYTVQNKQLAGKITEAGSAYMMNGKTSISVIPKAFKQVKATDALGLGENQPLGITYHEFAHALSQSRGKIDKEFWKEIRTIKKDYDNQRNTPDWFNVKISDYASKDVDEFLAEAFTQAKLSDNPSPYSKQVLDIVDKYFKKEPLENSRKSSTIKTNLQLFAEKDIKNQESNSLKRAIRKYQKQITEHTNKINNPQQYIEDWDSLSSLKQEGLKKHWKKEIDNFNTSINDRVTELKERGDFDE